MDIKIYNWLNELLLKKPEEFSEFYYSDIGVHLNIENKREFFGNLGNLNFEKIQELENCKSKSDVKIWLDKIVSYIMKNIEIDYLVDNYLAK